MESSEEVGKKIVAKTLHVFESSHIHFLKPYKSNINYIIIIIRLNLGLFSSDIFILRFVDIVGLLNLSLYISSRRFKIGMNWSDQVDPLGVFIAYPDCAMTTTDGLESTLTQDSTA